MVLHIIRDQSELCRY